MPIRPLTGLQVVDLSTWIAGAYTTKLLADAGAQVTKVEPVAGDPLRSWSASGAEIPVGESGALFNHLHAGKQSVAVDPRDVSALQELLAGADVAVWSRGSAVAEHPDLDPRELHHRHPHLTVVAITPFGLEGPWAGRAATEFTVQAWSGGIVGMARGLPELAPVHVGGQIGEWLAGTFAAVGALASLRRPGDAGELIDVSMLEASAMGLTYFPVTFNDQRGAPMRRKRFIPTPGVAAASDGLVGLGCGTGQQWFDFCAMVGHPEWTEDPTLFLDRTRLTPDIDAWIGQQTVADVLELAGALRIPNAPITDGANAPTLEHFQHRGTFRSNATDGALGPVPPYRLSSARLRPAEPAPHLGEHSLAELLDGPDRETSSTEEPSDALPFAGLRILDMTAYWAGPLVGSVLALLGAEVIHLESPSRPDGARLVGGVPQTEEAYWERGPIFAALNSNKKSLTVDLNDPRGVDVVKRVVATCDAVVENFTPRVLEQLGLTYDVLKAERDDLVMVRMPGFGLDGPWRDTAAFAFVIEDASGLTWLTGHPERLPMEPYTVGDPNAGLHALVGLLLALEHRDRTGDGCLVEAAMVDAALNVAAEQVVEHSAYDALLTRAGNRGPVSAPQNLYRAAAPDDDERDDAWVAIAVATDEQWSSLIGLLGGPSWAEGLDTHAARVAAHDVIDDHLAAWCRAQPAGDIVDRLWEVGVPVGKVMQPHRQVELAQLEARGFFEALDHPVAGSARYSTLPMRFSRGPERLHLRPAPALGEHTEELLSEVGVSLDERAKLIADGVIGMCLTVKGKR